jgi:hypothetical protein
MGGATKRVVVGYTTNQEGRVLRTGRKDVMKGRNSVVVASQQPLMAPRCVVWW